jgi:hypothetical protein
MTNVLLISETYLKQFSPIAANVSNEPLTVAIKKAQERYIKPILGKSLYDKMLNDIAAANSVTGLTTNYRLLLDDYITPALTEYSLYESIIPLTFKMQNKGIGVRNDAYQDSIGLEEVKFLRMEIKNNAEYYQERLIKYLANNTQLFPEYFIYTNDENPDSSTGAYTSGIYFKRKRRVNPANPFTFREGEDYNKFNY